LIRVDRLSALFVAVLLLGFLAVFQFPAARATALFSDGFESGGFSVWTGTDVDAGCSITINSTIVHTGSYSTKSSISTALLSWAECYENFAATNICYARAYYYFPSLPASGQTLMFHSLRGSESDYLSQVEALIYHSGTHYYWGIEIGTSSHIEASPSDPQINTWYCVEICRDRTNSLATLWIDGTQKLQLSNSFNSNSASLLDGVDCYTTAAAITCYVDDCVVADAYIGTMLSPLQFSSIGTSTVFPGQSCQFFCLISGSNVSNYIFSTNNTGTWTNDTAIPSGQTSVWANVTKILISTVRAIVGYEWFANDTSGKWGASGVLTLTTSQFVTKAPLPVGASDIPGVSYNGLIYVFGGFGTSYLNPLNAVYCYNATTNSWASKASMTYAEFGAAAAVYNGVAYLFGGYDGASGNRVQAYNFTSSTWTIKSNLPANLASAGYGGQMAVTVGSYVYVLFHYYIYRYNPASDTYTQLTSNSVERRWATCAYLNVDGDDRIYVIGGLDDSGGGLGIAYSTVYYYSVTHNNWTLVSGSAPYAGYGTTRDNPVLNGLIYYGYGNNANSTEFNSYMYSYNPVTNTWTQLSSGNYPRDGPACAFLGTTLYIIGGRNLEDPYEYGLTYNEAYNTQTVDTTPPTFGSMTANTTAAGAGANLSCMVSDNVAVSSYTYSWNNTGRWANQTAVSASGSSVAATLTGTWNSTSGNTVSVKVYANDTSNNWNASSQYNFTITPASAFKLAFTSGTGQTLVAGQLSGQITVQRLDQYGNLVTSGSITVSLNSTSLGAAFYSDAGGSIPVSSVTITSGSSTVSFWYKDTVAGSPTLTVSSVGSATTIFVISPASLDHFTITAVSSPQTAGVAFNISITAVDQYGNTVTGYAGQNTLSDLSGTISPTTTSSFSAGTWTGSLNITKAYSNDAISTSGSGKSGTTNSFNVKSAALDHFTMSSYPSSVITGQIFNITITAWDVFGNIVAGYTGQVYFTSSDSQAVLPYTSASKYTFTSVDNGSHVFTGFVLNTVSSQTITVTDDVKSATSNPIGVMLPIISPTYSNISASSTIAGQPCTFSSEWNDNYGLSGYIFSTNNTGVWQNTTWTPFSSTPSWANVTQSLNSNVGVVIGYYWYANNTNGLWTNTGLQIFTTTSGAFLSTPFFIVSNSTISQLAFNSTSEVLAFTVSGPSGTLGFTNVTIAKTITSNTSTLMVFLDGTQISYTVTDLTDSWSIYFTYNHSTHRVVMEFASQQTNTHATHSNEVLLAIIGTAIIVPAALAITIQRKHKSRNFTKRKN
jgi:hypothetical protein